MNTLTFGRIPNGDPEAVLRARIGSPSEVTSYGGKIWWVASVTKGGKLERAYAMHEGNSVYVIMLKSTSESVPEAAAAVLPMVLNNLRLRG